MDPEPTWRGKPLVVLPTYQEADNVVTVLGRIRAALPDGAILVVDDGSPDGTADLAEAAASELGQITVRRRAGKSGLGSAYRLGFVEGLAAGAAALVEMDADLSHDPAELPHLLAPVLAGEADLVVGSRYVPGGSIPSWSWHRRALSRWGNRYASLVLGLPIADSTSGFRAYSVDLVGRIDLASVRADGYGFQIEMAYRSHRLGARIREHPIAFVDRELGTSKMSSRIVVEALALVSWWGVRDRILRRG